MSQNAIPQYVIKDIRFGTNGREHILYAKVYNGEELVISATYDYCVLRVAEAMKEYAQK